MSGRDLDKEIRHVMILNQQRRFNVSNILGLLGEPFTGEQLFDCLSDIVYFIKDTKGQYQTINTTLVERCGCQEKSELIGKRPSDLVGATFGEPYEIQDRTVIETGLPLQNQLELHAYRSGEPGWCVTTKLPLLGPEEEVVGLVGISQDLKTPNLSSKEYERLVLAIEFTETNLSENLKVSQIAASASMSPFQFDRCIQRLFGLTAGQWILKSRIESAERQLVSTDLSIASIALNVGYSDQSTFTRQFHKTSGMSPANYRTAVRLAKK